MTKINVLKLKNCFQISIPYYRFIMSSGISKFARFARNVWNLEGKSEEDLAKAGLDAMKSWMEEIGVAKILTDLGAT